MSRTAHRKFIAEWIKDTKSPEEAKEILKNKKTVFNENVFCFSDDVDEVLTLAIAGDDYGVKELLGVLGDGTGEYLLDPKNDIFRSDDKGAIDLDKLEAYHENNNELYLANFNILTVYERGTDGMSTSSFPVYVIDYDNRVIHQLEYEETHGGDDQYLTMMDEYVPF